MPKISVVSPVYQAKTHIDSLLNHTLAALEPITPEFEIILHA